LKILLALHDFLPAHAMGAEVYTGALARRLVERGHEVRVFATEKDIGRPNLSLERREWEGLVVHELVQNLFYADFRETWDYPPAVAALERVLDEFRPDVVHFQHLLYLSVGCVEAVHARGLPILYTLHDFWLECARFGQRIHADQSVCHTIDFERCGTCLASFKYGQSPLERRVARAVAALGRVGLDLSGLARAAGDRLRRPSRGAPAEAPPEQARALAGAARRRSAELARRLVPRVERFLAPSRFLAGAMRAWGIPDEKLEVLGYGLELEPFEGLERRRSKVVRVAFLGTLAPHKAPHLVLEAWGKLPADVRRHGRLRVHGPKEHNPDYVARLERLAAQVGAELPGRLARADVPRELVDTDLLVVPSVWYENSPLTIHEALAARTPCLVSDLGGMAELVEPGRQGWRFRTGDSDDLAVALERVLRDPGQLTGLDLGPPPKDMRTSAQELEERYLAALDRRAG
jgi:glycosyltransferase involved in cell wall biosynthesis